MRQAQRVPRRVRRTTLLPLMLRIVESLHTTWIEYFDEEKELPYYFNVQRGEVQWNRPRGENVVQYDPDIVLVSRGNQSDVTFAFKDEAKKTLQSIRSSRQRACREKGAQEPSAEIAKKPRSNQSMKHVRSAPPTNMSRSQKAKALPVRSVQSHGAFGPCA